MRGAVARDLALHHLLRDDENDAVRAELAVCSDDPELVRRLAAGPDPDFRVIPALVHNPRAPTSVLLELLLRLQRQWDDGSGLPLSEQPLDLDAFPAALAEVHRVLAPGGRFGRTVWGNIKRSAGAWLMSSSTHAGVAKIEHQAATVSLGRPCVGEDLLSSYGFVGIERHSIRCTASKRSVTRPEHLRWSQVIARSATAPEGLASSIG